MTTHAPSPETVRLIARILRARETSQEELPDVIASVHRAVAALDGATAAPEMAAIPVRAPARVPKTIAAAPVRRARARRERAVFAAPTAPSPVASGPQLMRRTDMATARGEPATLVPKTRTGLRGVVKWFDLKTRTGALRLPGHEDVAVDADALDRAGMPRLFKGQEIEASIVSEPAGGARLVAMSLPGRPETEPLGALGGGRRNQKQVVIEMKRDALKRVGARLEAEQILGGTRR
jgi:cold shock CspA family protein